MMKETKTPAVRFSGFNDDWRTVKLGEVAERITRKNKNNESKNVLTISAQDGLVNQNDYFTKQVASKSLKNYYLLKKGDFAYNKSYSNGYPFGSIKRLEKYDWGVLSSLYIVFRPKQIVDAQFLSKYYDGSSWHKEIYKISAEGARNHGLLNVAVEDFFNTNLTLPTLSEQQQLGKLFATLDERINLQTKQLHTTQQLKQALLQQLLPQAGATTPQVRLRGFSDAWRTVKLGEVMKIAEKEPMEVTSTDQLLTVRLNRKGVTAGVVRKTLVLGKTKYFKRKAGQFIYGKQNFFHGAMDIIPKELDGLASSGDIPAMNIDNLKVDAEFLLQYLGNPDFYENTEVYATGTGSKRINEKKLITIPITLPSLPEQQQLGKLFATLDERIALQTQQVAHTKQLKAALLQQCLG